MAGYTHERFPSMSEVVYGKNRDTPVPIGMQVQSALQNTGFATAPAATRNAVDVAMNTTAGAPSMQRTGRAEDGPVSSVKPYDANMPNGSIRTVYQDSAYPGAPGPDDGGIPRAQSPNIQFAQFSPGGGSDFNTVQGGGGNGLFSPGLSGQLQDLYTRSNQLLSSRSMVDNWRGRQLAKMSQRIMLAESAMGNTRVGAANAQANMLGSQASALRAANEVPLEMMKDFTSQRGQDLQARTAKMNDATQRYGYDTQAGSSKYGVDANLASQLPRIQREDMENQLIGQDDFERAGEIARLGRFPPASKVPKFELTQDGQSVVMLGEDGRPTVESLKSIQARQTATAKEKEKLAEAAAKEKERLARQGQ